MIFNPNGLIKKEGEFVFSDKVEAIAHPCLTKDVIKEFWNNFTFGLSELTLKKSNEFIFTVGDAKAVPLNGNSYSINIEKTGVCVYAENERDLLHGYMTLLDRLVVTDVGEKSAVTAECAVISDKALAKNRMIHFCVFPETELWELQRFVRFCAALKYTHIVVEFWGMLKYDSLEELSWEFAFTKDEIRPIISEGKDLGLEFIPMFNHWGHAAASRALHGKHVVLDQNPALQSFFSPDGWCWDIKKPKVKSLLRYVREELCELCGEGEYFHIGLDEAYGFEFTDESIKTICSYINELSEEMKAKGRRVIAWGDMFLYKHKHYNENNRYTCNAPTAEIEKYMLDNISRDVIIADWQYRVNEPPAETSLVFKNAGFDTLICPWDENFTKLNSCLITAKNEGLFGYMHTTWHTLTGGMHLAMLAGVGGFEDLPPIKNDCFTKTAALMRRVMPAKGNYERAGWSKNQIGFKW